MSTPANKDRVLTLKESDALNALPALQLNPQALLARAIESNAGIETLERLVTLAKDIRLVTAREAYFEAMAQFQKRCPPIKKNKVMAVPGRPTYRYSDLGEILSAIGPLMGELGLSQSWRSTVSAKPNHLVKICQIAHRLGHTEDSGPCEVPYGGEGARMNPTQSVGSAETYAKRYSLCSVLGISPEDDTDASTSHGNEGRIHGEAASGAGERTPERTRSGVVTQAEQGNSSRSPRGGGPDSDKVEAEITVPLFSDPITEPLEQERKSLHAKIDKSTVAQIVLAMHRLDLGDGDWRTLDLAGLAMLAKHLAPKK